MKCLECNNDLFIAKSKLESAVDSTDIYSVQTLVCTNTKCKNYCGIDLKNPKKIVDIVRNKANE